MGRKTADVWLLAKPPIPAHFPLPTSVTVASIVRVEVLIREATSLPTSASLVTRGMNSKAAFTLAKLACAKEKNFSPLYLACISTPFTKCIPIGIKPV